MTKRDRKNEERAPSEVVASGKCQKRRKAEFALDPEVANAFIAHAHLGTQRLTDEESFSEFIDVFRERIRGVVQGEMAYPEAMLASQATTLNALFISLAHRAGRNMGVNMEAAERYMRLALKAQSQSRTTIEAIAEIKNPRQVAFVRQANIAAGNQQVNNGVAPARAEESQTKPNKLLEIEDGQWVEARPAGKAGAGNSSLEAVEEVHRSEVRRRKKAIEP